MGVLKFSWRSRGRLGSAKSATDPASSLSPTRRTCCSPWGKDAALPLFDFEALVIITFGIA
jgi:hypothetical protein